MLKLLDVFFHLYLIYDCYNDLCILICICFMIVSEIKNKQTNKQLYCCIKYEGGL